MPSILDIPVPLFVQKLRLEPPVCKPKEEDSKILDLIREFGSRFDRSNDEIAQACNLACGLSDLVVILERPYRKHDYTVSFDQFVRDCETLVRVDELIKFSSKGTRSIHTVTVLDAFSFKPDREQSQPPDGACHELIEKILKIKRPQVVLCCWTEGYNCSNSYVRQFTSLGVGRGDILMPVTFEHSTTTSIRSLHPSYAVNWDAEQKPYARILLICHFVLAFAVIAGLTEVPDWMETLCRGSRKEKQAVQKE